MPLRNILEKLVPAEQDKLQHFYLGTFLTLIFIFFTSWLSLVVNFTLVLGYEFYQKKTKTGQFEIKDALYGWLPSVLVALIILLKPWVQNHIIH